ncbi:amino acid permease [Escherichia coli]|nr:amino acid permease [Escherichia coli]
MSYARSYIHAPITCCFCVSCKATCAIRQYEITCVLRKLRRLYAITIT